MNLILALLIVLTTAFMNVAHGAALTVVVERMDNDAQVCGISEEQLASRAKLVLRNNRVDVDEKAFGYLYVNLTTLVSNGCVGHLQIQIRLPGTLLPRTQFRASKDTDIVFATICDKGFLLTGPRINFGSRVANAMEDKIKECLGSIEY